MRHVDGAALRRKLFGDKALAIKHGKIGLAASKGGVIEIDILDDDEE